MMAALTTVKAHHPLEIIVAVPVAAPDRLSRIREHCSRLICLLSPAEFYAVGQFYQSFDTVDDEEVMRILRQFNSQPAKPTLAGRSSGKTELWRRRADRDPGPEA
jgi:predicted phosphoribosyltransferase